jgi:hypothetical protein
MHQVAKQNSAYLPARLITVLKMEVIRSSETSVHISSTRLYIQEGGNIHNYLRENLKTYNILSSSIHGFKNVL